MTKTFDVRGPNDTPPDAKARLTRDIDESDPQLPTGRMWWDTGGRDITPYGPGALPPRGDGKPT
jgi:hypothetical protein